MATKPTSGAKAAKKTAAAAAKPSLTDLIADAADIKARATKLLAGLRKINAHDDGSPYEGDPTPTRNPR
jgi:hypothetical protein